MQKSLLAASVAALLTLTSGSVLANAHAASGHQAMPEHDMAKHDMTGHSMAEGKAMAAVLTKAEVVRVGMDDGKVSLKHEAIKNLNMPAMTMGFAVKDKALLNGLNAGDKVQFSAEMMGGKMVVTHIEKGQ
ncbi:MAG: copper-binding protein [Aeromonas sp.]